MGLKLQHVLPLIVGLAACTSTAPAGSSPVALGPPFAMDFTRAAGLWDAPFPSDDLRKSDGHIDLSRWQNPDQVTLIDQCLALLTRDARGFAQAGAIYLRAGAALDPASLPALATSVTADATVFVTAIDPLSPDFLQRRPIDVAFMADGGPMGAKNLLAILPLQGAPLLAKTRYAAVVTARVRYADQTAPARPLALDQLLGGITPAGMPADVALAYRQAIPALALLVQPGDIAALAVFTTDDRAADLLTVFDDALAKHPIAPLAIAPTLTETYDNYCVFQSTVDLPVYQAGTPPYNTAGGDWQFDAAGTPLFDHTETGRIWFTVPRQAVPTEGVPTVVFIGTGGGGERPLVDRGVCATKDFTVAITPGSGPAQEFARVGWAGVQIDGTLEGMRNTTHGNEDFLLFNVFNPAALRDNVRQSALEIRLLREALKAVSFDVQACPGASGTFRVHADRVGVMGHSMGATILPLTLSDKSAFQEAILSGAGGSYIANVMDKTLPLPVKPVAEGLLGYDVRGRSLTPQDPALTLFQWAVESSDPQIYGPRILAQAHAPNVLMLQGLVDHYILPSIANAFSLATGLDLAGPALDAQSAELVALGQRSVATLLALSGKQPLPLPVSGNHAGLTAVVVQNMGDGIEDGHEANFQTERPKQLYRCFLADLAAGKVPVIRDTSTDACW